MKKPNLHLCNVLEPAQPRRLWSFTIDGKDVKLSARETIEPSKPVSPKLTSKDWRSLWRPKLNVAWLPADQVFLRVIHLPASDFAELLSMVEFQLEKLSPLPVNQIVWSVEVLPQKIDNLQTVVVTIVSRGLVEEFLGRLESEGYLADRLELPFIQQLLAVPVEGNGAWIYPVAVEGRTICFVAWWYGGALQQLQLLHLQEKNGAATLTEQLTKAAWAGEMEGWLKPPTQWRLVAAPDVAAEWEPILSQWAGERVEVLSPLDADGVATLTARRAARGESTANLLPAEYSARYRQQFVDRLWMTGLAGVIGAYVVGVAIYLIALQVLKYQHYSVERQVAGLSAQYTNAIKLREQVEVLQKQLDLKFAALDSLKVASELLPAELSLTRFAFSRGQTVTLEGTAPADQSLELTTYNQNLRKATIHGEPLFSKVEPPSLSTRGQQIAWRFSCELSRGESE